jgi:hypothetical protein
MKDFEFGGSWGRSWGQVEKWAIGIARGWVPGLLLGGVPGLVRAEEAAPVRLTVKWVELRDATWEAGWMDWFFGVSGDPADPVRTLLPNGIVEDRMSTTNQWRLLDEAQFGALMDRLAGIGNVDLLTLPTVMVPGGKSGQAAATETRNLVTGPTTVPGPTGTGPATMFGTVPFPVGTVVDLKPHRDGLDFRLGVVASYTEFVGYDAPTNVVPAMDRLPVVGKVGVTAALPRVLVRSVEAEVKAVIGTWILLRGPAADRVTRTKSTIPVLGSLPWVGGHFTKEQSQTNRARIYILIGSEPEAKPAGKE